jgi:hypothetical protein
MKEMVEGTMMSESGGYGEPDPIVETPPEPDETTNPPLPDGGPGQHHPDLPPTEKPTQDEPLLT